MKNIWSILSNSSIKDEESKKISIINVVDSIGALLEKKQVGKKNFVNLALELISCWSGFDGDYSNFIIRVRLVDPKKNILLKTELNVEKNKNEANKKLKNIITNLSFKSFPVTISGFYVFEISQKKEGEESFKIVSNIPVNVDVKII